MPSSPRVSRAARPAALLLFVVCLGAPEDATAASFPPGYHFRSLSTPRITVHFHQGLEPLAREAAALANRILEAHEAHYGTRIAHLHIVIADNEDDPNGFATPLPYPVVQIRAASPDGSDQFGNLEGWLKLVLTHELAHSVHLEQARGVIRVGRKIFGRAPFLFPNALTPTWLIEGLATYEETEGTAFGRGRNPDSRMVLRMAALEEKFPHQDQAVLGYDLWPSGQTAYLFGESFLRDVSARSGPSTLPDLARAQSGKIVPFLDDLTSREVTGVTFHGQWQDWQATSTRSFAREAEQRGDRGVTASRALTTAGIRQDGPRFSPDGKAVVYSSRTLTRYPALRVVNADGAGDRKLTDRSGGSSASWTPDGKSVVFDDTRVYRTFSRRGDLRRVDVESGKTRWLTHGVRARDPDVSPDGRAVVFVRRMGDRSELATLPLDGGEPRTLTASVPGTEWSGPRWRPQGDVLVASRLLPGGFLDLVEVDPASGEARALTDDRAKDVEPAWTPDGEWVVYRSDRDGVSNLYGRRRSDGLLVRVSNVLGGAFTPTVAPDGKTVAFANYSARGFDVHVANLDLDAAGPVAPFFDTYPPPTPSVEPVTMEAKGYQPLPALLPRFWSPVVLRQDGEWRYGAAIAGLDPLFRHSYGVTAYVGADSKEVSTLAFYQYDRFWPTFLVTGEDEARMSGGIPYRDRILNVRASFPVVRTMRSAQSLSLTWRRESQSVDDDAYQIAGVHDRGGIEAAWTWSAAQQYPQSVSPIDGGRLRFAFLREDPALGSQLSLSKITGDARTYLRAFGESDVLAVRVGGGTTVGERGFRRTFAIGGYPDSSIFDLVRANEALLRGYPDDAFTGRNFAQANLEYRFPLGSPQRGWRTLPLFLRHLRGTVFFDAANVWNGDPRFEDVKTAAGASLGVDTYLANRLPFVGEMALARGFAQQGDTLLYFRVGLAF